jgi:hypothetical protein
MEPTAVKQTVSDSVQIHSLLQHQHYVQPSSPSNRQRYGERTKELIDFLSALESPAITYDLTHP